MQISPKELRSIASDIDDMHHESMRTFKEECAELHLGASLSNGRRNFLKKAAVGGGAIAIGSALVPMNSLLASAGAQGLTDVDIAVFAESVELAAVAAYTAGAGLLTPEVLPVAQLFLQHHQEHAGAFAALSGGAATGTANAALLAALQPTIDGLTDQAGVLAFAKDVENQAAVTYAFALTVLQSAEAASGTATILPVEVAHATALGMALGESGEALFPTGAFESADIAKGIDPGLYPVA